MQPVCQDVEEAEDSVATLGEAPRLESAPRSLEEFAYRFGQYYDSYLATDLGRETIWSRNGQGAVSMVRSGRYVNIGGGLIAPAEHREALLGELVASAARRGDALSFYNVTEDDLPLFRRHGFQATKLGEEAVIDLDEWSCRGKAFEWLRRQSNYCRREAVEVTEYAHENAGAADRRRVVRELMEVSTAFLAAKPQAVEMRFLDGTFDAQRLGRRRVFVARSEAGRNAGRIEGFLVCNPYLDGEGWAFEIYRQRPDAVRGTVPYLMHQAIEALRNENVRRVSLCLIPGLRAAAPLPGDSPLVRWALALGSRHFNFVFDTAGLFHFKSRFRPRFESRYLCVRPRVTLGSAWSFVRLLGVLELSPGKLARVVGRRLRKRGRRATLAMPSVKRSAPCCRDG
jgi:phosphatidylglycerol lysyltransferase